MDAGSDTAVAAAETIAEDAGAANTTVSTADTDTDANVTAGLMQRWIDLGRLPALTQMLASAAERLSQRVGGKRKHTIQRRPKGTYGNHGLPASFLQMALQQEQQKLDSTLAVIRQSLAELIAAQQRNDFHMRSESDAPTGEPLPASACYVYRRVQLRDLARSLHALQVPSSWIDRPSPQGQLLLWFQNFVRKLEYLHSLTNNKHSKPHHNLWVRALSNPHIAINAAAIDMCNAEDAPDPGPMLTLKQSGAGRRAVDGWPIASPQTRQSFRCTLWRHIPKEELDARDGQKRTLLCLSGLLLFGCRWDVESERLVRAPAAVSLLQELPPLQLKQWEPPEPKEVPDTPIPDPMLSTTPRTGFQISRSQSTFAAPRSPIGGFQISRSVSNFGNRSPLISPPKRLTRAMSFDVNRPLSGSSLRSSATPEPEPEPGSEEPLEYRCPVYAFPSGSVSASGNRRYNGGVVCSIHLLCRDKETLDFCESRCVSLFCREEE